MTTDEYEQHRRDELARTQARDLDNLRALALCVKRGRYAADPPRTEGGRRGKARIVTLTFYVEVEDWHPARAEVQERTRD